MIFFSRGRSALWSAVLIAAAVVRFVFAGAVVGFDTPPKADEADYHAIAAHLVAGEGFVSVEGYPTARRPPAYPMFLSAIYSVTGESPRAGRIAQVLLGVAVVFLTGRVARRFFGRAAAIWAASLAALNPFLIFISGYLLTENLYLVLLMGALVVARSPRALAASTRRALTVGALLGLATLARPSGLPMFEWFVAALFLLSPLSRHTRVIRATALAFAFVLVVLPWYVRNARVVGGWVLTTHGGVTFLQGNNEKVASVPQWRGGVAPLEVLPRSEELMHLDELSRDRLAWKLGREYLRTHPGQVPELVTWKMIRYWRLKSDMGLSGIKSGWWFDKNSTLGRVAANVDVGFVYAIVVMPLFVVGLVVTARRWRDLALVYGVIVVHTAIAAVFFGSLRTRIPVEPVMCVLAAGALLTVARGVRVRRSAPVPPRT